MRLIDADKLYAAITYGEYTTGNIFMDMELHQFINEQPTVQPQGIDKDRLIEELKKVPPLMALNDNTGDMMPCIPSSTLFWLINQQPQTGWIPCSERLPDMENVLGTTEECEIKMVWYNPNLKKWFGSPVVHIENVIAWQPLPQPYKESEEDED